MASINVCDLELLLENLKEKEARLKEELAAQRKKENAKANKKLVIQKCNFADFFIDTWGMEILNKKEELVYWIQSHGFVGFDAEK